LWEEKKEENRNKQQTGRCENKKNKISHAAPLVD